MFSSYIILLIGPVIYVALNIRAIFLAWKMNNVTFIKVLYIPTIIIVTLFAPVAYFIGGMALDAPDTPESNFWYGFFFIEGVPLVILLFIMISHFFIKKRIRNGN